MKDGVVLVNTARGAVIDEDALAKALDNGKVASVGLDVYEHEPNIHQGLMGNPHVMLLPHMGTWSVEVSLSAFLRAFRARVWPCVRQDQIYSIHFTDESGLWRGVCWLELVCLGIATQTEGCMP